MLVSRQLTVAIDFLTLKTTQYNLEMTLKHPDNYVEQYHNYLE